MSIAACAEKVRAGDPDRFLATMAAPVPVRQVLFPIHAFALEVARAPWVTEEPLIAQMRLQWWHDALEEIGGSGTPRRHEVVDALALVLPEDAAAELDKAVTARDWDIHREAFEDAAHFDSYIDGTSAAPLRAALVALKTDPVQATAAGRAIGLARFLQAVPELEARGRIPLVDGRASAVAALAKDALQALRPLSGPARAVCRELSLARPILRQAALGPARVAEGRLGLSDFGKRWRLLLP